MKMDGVTLHLVMCIAENLQAIIDAELEELAAENMPDHCRAEVQDAFEREAHERAVEQIIGRGIAHLLSNADTEALDKPFSQLVRYNANYTSATNMIKEIDNDK